MDPLLKIVLVQTHSELSETDNLRDEAELIAREVCTEDYLRNKIFYGFHFEFRVVWTVGTRGYLMEIY